MQVRSYVHAGGGRPPGARVGPQGGQLALQLRRRPYVVVVQEGDPGCAAGCFEAGVAGGGGAAGAAEGHERYPGVGESGDRVRGAVSRAVVDHHAADIAVGLVQYGLHGLDHEVAPVIGGYDHHDRAVLH